MSDPLRDLADRCGIAAGYDDIWGTHHPTQAYTRQALLTAMHFPPGRVADDPPGLLAEIDRLERERPLPPVLVVRAGEAPVVPLALPEAAATWQWRLELETGAADSGRCVPADLPEGQLVLPPVATLGYHRLTLSCGDASHAIPLTMPLIVVPPRCHQPQAITDTGRVWGLTVQLYGVRSQRNWGIGDFTDLATLLDVTAAAGGAIVGVNPLHALFPDNPAHISPYSPSGRSFVNILYLDVEAVPEFAGCEAARHRVASADFQARLETLRATELVDYPGVAQAKLEILAMLFAHFTRAGGARAAEFAAWRTAQGDELERHARFEALQAHFRAKDANCWGWPVWPEAYRDPASPAVAAFAREHAPAIAWHAWLQWQADTQLAAIAAHARRRAMGIGLYQDLAIGANPGGAEAWNWQEVFATGAHAGAPPDEINLLGQDWGLPPFVPERLRDAGYAPFIDILRANMKHAGALRIDHVMGLMRVFWVAADTPATEGAYVHYPFEDLLGIVALESRRNGCLVIGEDLGTVPDGFRDRLAAAGVLSYHPLIFERYPDGQFRLPADVPRQALVAVSTHDLPTLPGFWRGTDLEVRTALRLFPSDELRQRLITERGWDRGRLLWALECETLLPAATSKEPAAMPEISAATVTAVHAYLARSLAQIMVVQPEDIFGVSEQNNVPGTLDDQHPNWQRKLPLSLEEWQARDDFRSLVAALRAER